MGYEVDFIPVGNGEKSGDAIALRFGDLLSGKREDFTVVVIDGGYKDSGETLVKHLDEFYETNHVDLVISTHPDADHCSGLQIVLEKCTVGKLWMHRPWLETHTNGIADMFQDGRVTDNSVREKLKDSLNSARELERLAQTKKISITEPFADLTDDSGDLKVLGPSTDFYESLLPGFRGTPEAKKDEVVSKGLLGKVVDFVKNLVEERFDVETLSDATDTSAENDSGTILLLSTDDRHLLFTSDTSAAALEKIANEVPALTFIQVPHHGSRHNVNAAILDQLVGPKLMGEEERMTAFVSCSKGGAPRHPAKQVTNAFRRRGAAVHPTQGNSMRGHYQAPARDGWSASVPLELFTEVESD